MSSGLLLLVVGVGLADSVNPVPIALAVVFATRSLLAVLQFTVASFVVTCGAGLLLTAIPGDALHDWIHSISPRTVHVGQLVGGVTALAVAAWLLLHQARQPEDETRWVSASRPHVVGG